MKSKGSKNTSCGGELEDKDKFNRLLPGRKRLLDTGRMVAYRSETAMAGPMINNSANMPDAKRLMQDLFVSEADIFPDVENDLLRVRIHNASTPAANRALASLFDELNTAEVEYPETKLRLKYEIVNKEIRDRDGVGASSQG